MGVTIYYQPVHGTRLDVGLRSKFMEVMAQAFGDRSRWTLDDGDTDKLRGMQAAWEHGGKPFDALIEVIYEHGEILVWGSY